MDQQEEEICGWRSSTRQGRCWKDRGGDKLVGTRKLKSWRDSGSEPPLVPLGPRLGILFSFPQAPDTQKETWCHVQPGATPVEERGRMREEKNGTLPECVFLQPPISEVVDTMALEVPRTCFTSSIRGGRGQG